MKTKLKCTGMLLPVIADLGDGYWLVGHPNGIGIGTEHSITALELAAGEEPKEGTWEEAEGEGREESCLPYEVRRAALEKYTDWVWPLVKSQLDFTNWNPKAERDDKE
jgi:hypothetical protein